jgi:hypothetical protein
MVDSSLPDEFACRRTIIPAIAAVPNRRLAGGANSGLGPSSEQFIPPIAITPRQNDGTGRP